MESLKDEELQKIKKLFGENLKRLREQEELSLLQAGHHSNFDNSNISKYENGKREPRLSTIIALAKMLKTHPKNLIDFGIDFTEEGGN
ncbi:helix-turn-helix transcriptional regulator [Flavihumibacter sp. R14]|nr:helix-turn-helix transcriptional regulator [Flavihumibacter soli]